MKNTLGKVLQDKKVKAEQIRVLDPACGSGSFLIKAFDVLNEFYVKHDKNYDQTKLEIELEDATYSKKLQILQDHIFGVDLDKQAVEVAQLNLLLKLAEKGRRLPLLQKNIQNGNSLIDDRTIAGDKAFDWQDKFKQIMDNGGFDVIIGNPPYVRIQTLDKAQVDYFNTTYESPEKNYDIYILFIEKGFKLLREGGILGFILPHKFFQGENGKRIREFIYRNKAVYQIVDFGTNQVFEDASTYTCLLFLQKKKNKEFYYKRFNLGEDFKNLSSLTFEKKDIEILREDMWNFSNSEIQGVLDKIKSQPRDFRSITRKIFKGSSTGNDEIFLLDLIKERKDTCMTFSSALNQEVELESELLHPFVYGEDVRRYSPVKNKKVLLFPYVTNGNDVELIPIDILKKDYPKTFDYLSKLKNELLKRKVELNHENFYKYSAARSLSEYAQPKIMIPDMLVSNRISFDEEGTIYHGPAIHSIVFNDETKKHNPYFYLGILNSRLFWFFIANTSTALRGNAYRLTPEFLTPFCFPEIGEKNKQLYDRLVSLVERMMELKGKLSDLGDKNTDERTNIEEKVDKIDMEMDECVYKLYGITDEEKNLINLKGE